MRRLRTLFELFRIVRRGTNIGDAAVLKLTLFAEREGNGPHRAGAVALAGEMLRPITLDALRQHDAGTFGPAYLAFMERNGLTPFNFSEDVRDVIARFPVSSRYARVHDMIHVLLGFEADVVGELGVYAFVGRQGYGDVLDRGARWAHRFGRLLFWKRARVTAAEDRGRALADGVPSLVAAPLEAWLDRPLDEVRAELQITAA